VYIWSINISLIILCKHILLGRHPKSLIQEVGELAIGEDNLLKAELID